MMAKRRLFSILILANQVFSLGRVLEISPNEPNCLANNLLAISDSSRYVYSCNSASGSKFKLNSIDLSTGVESELATFSEFGPAQRTKVIPDASLDISSASHLTYYYHLNHNVNEPHTKSMQINLDRDTNTF